MCPQGVGIPPSDGRLTACRSGRPPIRQLHNFKNRYDWNAITTTDWEFYEGSEWISESDQVEYSKHMAYLGVLTEYGDSSCDTNRKAVSMLG